MARVSLAESFELWRWLSSAAMCAVVALSLTLVSESVVFRWLYPPNEDVRRDLDAERAEHRRLRVEYDALRRTLSRHEVRGGDVGVAGADRIPASNLPTTPEEK